MQSLRKLMNKPRPDDWAPLAKFYYADEALNDIGNLKNYYFFISAESFFPENSHFIPVYLHSSDPISGLCILCFFAYHLEK